MAGACGGEAVIRGASFSTSTFPASPCSLPLQAWPPKRLGKSTWSISRSSRLTLFLLIKHAHLTTRSGVPLQTPHPQAAPAIQGVDAVLGRASVLGSELGHQALLRVWVLCLYGYHSSCCSRELRGRPGGSPGLCVSSSMSPLCDEALLPWGQSPLRDLGLLFLPECKEPEVPRHQPAALSQGPWVSPGESVSPVGIKPSTHPTPPRPRAQSRGKCRHEGSVSAGRMLSG